MKKKMAKLLATPGIVLWAIFLVTPSPQVHAQQQTAKQAPAPEPAWIKMMDDPNVNFFEIDKNFNDYWKGRELPVEEDEILDVKNNSERKRGFLGLFRRKEKENEAEREKEKEKKTTQQYAFEYKKYLWWRRQVLPYVQPDGRILSSQEQVNIWQQQKQLKNSIQEKQLRDKKNKNRTDSTNSPIQ